MKGLCRFTFGECRLNSLLSASCSQFPAEVNCWAVTCEPRPGTIGIPCVWAVINYLFPCMELIGEERNETLRQFIPRMEGAKNALDYHLAEARMITQWHTNYSGTTAMTSTSSNHSSRTRRRTSTAVLTGG